MKSIRLFLLVTAIALTGACAGTSQQQGSPKLAAQTVPAQFAATDKQKQYINGLAARLEVTGDSESQRVFQKDVDALSKREASKLIDELKTRATE